MKVDPILAAVSLIIFCIQFDNSQGISCYATPSATCKKAEDIIIGWQCVDGKCIRDVVSCEDNAASSSQCLMSLNVCKILCEDKGTLWPLPSGDVKIGKLLTPVDVGKLAFVKSVPSNSDSANTLSDDLFEYFTDNIELLIKEKEIAITGIELLLSIEFHDDDIAFHSDADEHYTLVIQKLTDKVSVTISSTTYFGVRHGVETLLQLIVYDEFTKAVYCPEDVNISDGPSYKYRGLLLDTARSYYSVKSIKKVLNVMALNKLNSFHWHITDTQSFPYLSKKYPQMAAYGAYSPSQVYTSKDIKEIVKYAKVLGIRVTPEFDAPAHVGEGWQYFEKIGKKDNISYVVCFKSEPWQSYCVEPPCGQLNPTTEKIYDVLQDIYEEYSELFDTDLFHMGGDEVNFNCWRSVSSIIEWMNKNGIEITDNGFLEIWNKFQEESYSRLKKVNKRKQRPILWTSSLTESVNVKKYLDSNEYIIQIWTKGSDDGTVQLIKNGYDVILSNYDALYFDCGFGSWIGNEKNNWCSPYIGWQTVYANNPLKVVQSAGVSMTDVVNLKSQLLGSEAALWSEQADDKTSEGRLWPRAAALAETLWTDPSTGWEEAVGRLVYHRERMVARGVDADLVQMQWCLQNNGKC